MHRVVVVPPTTPNEAVLLKDFDYLERDVVAIAVEPIFIRSCIAPIVGLSYIDINCNSEGMRRYAISTSDRTPVECATRILQVLMILRR